MNTVMCVPDNFLVRNWKCSPKATSFCTERWLSGVSHISLLWDSSFSASLMVLVDAAFSWLLPISVSVCADEYLFIKV